MAVVLAMTLLGPAPAVAIALAAVIVDAIRCRPKPLILLIELGASLGFPFVGGAPERCRRHDRRPEPRRAICSRRRRRLHVHELPQLRDGRRLAAGRGEVSFRESLTLGLHHGAAVGVRVPASSRPASRSAISASASAPSVSLPSCSSSSSTCSRPASRPTTAASSSSSARRELASLQVGLHQHGDADAVDARRHDRAPLRRRRPLLARGRPAARAVRARAGARSTPPACSTTSASSSSPTRSWSPTAS